MEITVKHNLTLINVIGAEVPHHLKTFVKEIINKLLLKKKKLLIQYPEQAIKFLS
jgi:hypothetical protein